MDLMKPPVVLYEPPKRQCTDYRVGLSAWMDKSILEESDFYPHKTMTPEDIATGADGANCCVSSARPKLRRVSQAI
jgi:hypothetical protein